MKTERQITINPHFDKLTPQAIEVLKNLGDVENAKKWCDYYADHAEYDETEIAFMLAMLEAIKIKAEDPQKTDHPVDFIGAMQSQLFAKTMAFDQTVDNYLAALVSGDFIVEEIVYPNGEEPPEKTVSEEIMPPEKSAREVSKAVSFLLNADETPEDLHNLLADYVNDLQMETPESWKEPESIERHLNLSKTKNERPAKVG